jgi:hypothetical protein
MGALSLRDLTKGLEALRTKPGGREGSRFATYFIMRLGFARMDYIRKFHRVLDEEDWNIVADNVPVTLLCVKFEGEASHVSHCVGATSTTQDCRESHEHGGLSGGISEDAGIGDIGGTLMKSKGTKGASTPRMDDSFRNAFVIEPVYLQAGK